MEKLTATEQTRLQNLRALHARPGGAGGPTSDYLVDYLKGRGVSINKTDLSNIYWEKKTIGDHLAKSIEKAFEIPSGWLSEDHEFLYGLPPGELAAYRQLASLPANIKTNILFLVRSITEHNAK